MKYWNVLTTPTKIAFILWTLDSFYMLFSGESRVNFFQWLIVWLFGCFIFCGIAQLISTKIRKNKSHSQNELTPNQEKVYREYQKALNDMGNSFSNFFKEAYYVNTTFLGVDSSETYYVFTYKAESRDQLNYLLSNQKEMFEKLDGKPIFSVLFDTTFQMKIGNTAQHRETTTSTPCIYNNFDVMDGHDFEYFCADLLTQNGFSNVEVTQGSGDHGIDILAEKDSITYAIQCKCYSKDVGNAAIQQAHTGKSIYKKDIAVVLTNRDFTPQAKEEAEMLGVKLWNREKLLSLINTANN